MITAHRRAIVVAAALTLSLAACGDDDPASDSSSAGDDGSTGEAAAVTEPTTLTVWDYGYFPDQNQEALEAIDAAFSEANPNITIEHEGIPYDTFFERFRAAIAAGEGPDVVSMYPSLFAQDYAQGLQPIDDAITDELAEEVTLLDISRAPDGQLYSVPWTTYGFTYFANTDLWSQAGIDELPDTWDGLLESCQTLRAAGIEPFSFGWQDGYMGDWLHYVHTDMLVDSDELEQLVAAELPLNDPKLVQSVEFVQAMGDAGCFAEGADGRTYADAEEYFAAGDAAAVMGVATPNKLRQLSETIGEDAIDVFAPPMVPGSTSDTQIIDMGPNSGYGVTAWTPSRDAAVSYISYLLSAEAQQIAWDNLLIPNSTAVELSSDWKAEQNMLDLYALPGNLTTYLAFPASVMVEMERQTPAWTSGDVSAEDITGAMEDAMSRLRPKYTN